METVLQIMNDLWVKTGIYGFMDHPGQLVMIFIGLLLLFLAEAQRNLEQYTKI